jgi:radical SAM superfamily enzyme YgiQ (UPF0313 family)
MKIGYITFGRDDLSYGLSLCLSRVHGHELFRVTPKTARHVDVIVFSLFWWEHLYVLHDWLERAGIRKSQSNRPRLIAGGFTSFSPVPTLQYVDAVIVGDGESELERCIHGDYSSPHVLTDGKDSVTWKNEAALIPFVHETNGIARIEIARGCKARCKFCAVCHLKPYRELSIADIRTCLLSTNQTRVSLFAPEPTMHSDDDEITDICRALGKVRVDSDVRLDRLEFRSDSVPRVGIEGISHRLRKTVNKGYSDEFIIEAVRKAIDQGRKGIFMYFILDLPTECDEDWEQFRNLLVRIGQIPGSDKFLLKPSPSVFLPTPGTPMELEGINWDRDYKNRWDSFFGRGDDRDWEVMMAERSRVFSPHMRLLSMLSTRGGIESRDVIARLFSSKAISISSGRPAIKNKMLVQKIIDPEKYCSRKEKSDSVVRF